MHSSQLDVVRCFWFSISFPPIADTFCCGFCCIGSSKRQIIYVLLFRVSILSKGLFTIWTTHSFFCRTESVIYVFTVLLVFSVNFLFKFSTCRTVVLRLFFLLQELELLFIMIIVIFACFLRIYGMNDKIGGKKCTYMYVDKWTVCRTKIRKKISNNEKRKRKINFPSDSLSYSQRNGISFYFIVVAGCKLNICT